MNNVIEIFNTREELNKLTDRELRDIGLNRYEIEVYYKTNLMEEVDIMYKTVKNFLVELVTTLREGMEMRDKILAKYPYIGA
jgi:hypothetical protein